MTPNNFSHHWCAIMIENLIAQGIDHFFIAPGSRSTPLVSAVARNPRAKITLSIDERSLGFLALGYGKCAQKAGAVIVTSGTAVANLSPAAIEAFLSEVPLLLITADRPYELRDCGANQTIFQADFFTPHINKSFDLAPPSPNVSFQHSLAIFDQASRACVYPKKGPVHVNVQLREPLANLKHDNEPSWSLIILKSEKHHYEKKLAINDVDVNPLLSFLDSPRGLIVVGELSQTSLQEKILQLSTRLKWPIIADITSNLRLHHHENILHHADVALLNESFTSALNVNRVLRFGARIVSKRINSFIEKIDGPRLSLSESHERIDHTGVFAHLYVPQIESIIASLLKTLPTRESAMLSCVQREHEKISRLVDEFLENKRDNEGYYLSRLVSQISEPTNIFVSSSMPIRDLDQFAKPALSSIAVFANRGASGIDGITSTALGIGIADDKPLILIIGDVAFLHDTNGLMLVAKSRAPVLIIVINNNGGGIFHFLPIGQEADVVTPFLDTPHDVCLGSLCVAHRVRHQKIEHARDFDEAMRNFYVNKKSMVLEVMIDRNTNVRLHKEFYERVGKSVKKSSLD